MNNSKLLKVLNQLNYKERKSFRKFVQSPFYNEREKLVVLANYIIDRIDENSCPEKVEAFNLIFPGEPYEDLQIRHLLSDLYKLCQKFLAATKLDEESILEKKLLLSTLRKKGFTKNFKRNLNSLSKELEKIPFKDTNYYQDKFDINAELNTYMEDQKIRTIEPNLENTVEALDELFVLNKLRYGCYILNYSSFMNFSKRSLMMDEIFEHVASTDYSNHPAIEIYYHIYKALKNPENQQHFLDLKSIIGKFEDILPKDEGLNIYNFAQNYCIRKVNKGVEGDFYLKELFHLYKSALEKELIFEDGKLSPWNYKNITVIGLRLGEYNWIQNFLKYYKIRLAPKYQENAYRYNMAKLNFYRKNYDEVLSLLQEVEYDDIFYSLDSRSMLLKTYYELDEMDVLHNMADTFKVYLRRKKKISDINRKNYLNMLKFMKKLTKIMPGDKEMINKFSSDLNKAENVADIYWFREKLLELK